MDKIVKFTRRGLQKRRRFMKKEKNKFIAKQEIQKTREELYNYIDKEGIGQDPLLFSINKRLDELILQWMTNNK
jgi:hypothetical protein